MAHQLIGDMTTTWKPEDFADEFTSAIHKLAAQRVEAGKTEKVTPLEGESRATGVEQRGRPDRAVEEEPGVAQADEEGGRRDGCCRRSCHPGEESHDEKRGEEGAEETRRVIVRSVAARGHEAARSGDGS